MVGYLILQKYFRRTSIELQRVDAVSRSPVYANFSETMSGLDTIRAYRLQERCGAACSVGHGGRFIPIPEQTWGQEGRGQAEYGRGMGTRGGHGARAWRLLWRWRW